MDRTDIILSLLLLEDSRIPYRALAEKLNLSANAVHKRIQSLIDLGIIRRFTTKLNLVALQATIVIIYGKSEAESTNNIHEKLSKNNSIYWAALGGGNFVYIGAYLKSTSEVGSLIDFVKREADMPSPSIGILPISPSNHAVDIEKTLYSLDRQIINSLSNNSRRTIADIADEVGAASKTVRRRLSAMRNKGLVEFSIQWYPDSSNDIMTILHIRLRPEADNNTVTKVMKSYYPNLLLYYQFINAPNELFGMVWTNTMKELRELQQGLTNEKVVASVVSNILYTGYIFDTWRDELIHPKGEETGIR